MKERPIVFSNEMVCAILDGFKTMTRLVIKPQPDYSLLKSGVVLHGKEYYRSDNRCKPISTHGVFGDSGNLPCFAWLCPYGVPGDRLWLRETWGLLKGTPSCEDSGKETIYYKCDRFSRIVLASGKAQPTRGEPVKWRPSIFMPRWASRITLEITDVKVERAQDITDEDAIKEGIVIPGRIELNELSGGKFIYAFKNLWDSTNAKRGFGWDVNPWVWCISFRAVRE